MRLYNVVRGGKKLTETWMQLHYTHTRSAYITNWPEWLIKAALLEWSRCVMKPAHSFEASGTMKETERPRALQGWWEVDLCICRPVCHCCRCRGGGREGKGYAKNSNETSFMLHVSVLQHYRFYWSPCYEFVAVHHHMLATKKHHWAL